MDPSDIVVITITLARTKAEEQTLRQSLSTLVGYPLVISDGGSRERFQNALLAFTSYLATPDEKGLIQQVKAGLWTALSHFPKKRAFLYTEPDKYPFFEGPLARFVSAVPASTGVALASRDESSLRSFPAGQQWTERFMNEATALALGAKSTADYCYGPLLLSRRAAEIALDSPNDLGWGWRFWLMGRAKRAGLSIKPVIQRLACPLEQRHENSRADRLYRLKQLRQNLTGLELGLAK